MFARAFGGFFGGTASVTAAFIVDLYPESKRAGQFARLGAALLAAFVFGPFVGGGCVSASSRASKCALVLGRATHLTQRHRLAQFGLRVPFYAAAGLSFIAMTAALAFVENPRDLPGSEVSRKLATGKKKKDDGDGKIEAGSSDNGVTTTEVELVELGEVERAAQEEKER